VLAELEEITAEAVRALGPGSPAILNASPYERTEVVGDGLVTVPGLGSAAVSAAVGAGARAEQTGDTILLENQWMRVTVDRDGLLASVRDRVADRELLSGPGNLLQLHPDHPNAWDAWDIDRHYRRRHTDLTAAESVELVESGPLRATVRVVRAFGTSRVTQEIRLTAASRRLDIVTDIDWQESEKVLKAAFPLDVHAERSAAEIQFGHVHRPTHTNTGWDAARFEICAHRWLRVAEDGYGVAVLNDSTYGHDVTRTPHEQGLGTTVRLTLLRAPHSPDPETDLGTHRFTYALLPGAGVGDAVAEGLALNLPLRSAAAPSLEPLVSVDNPAVTVESVKLAEDRSGDVVVRLYESRGGRARATLTTGFPVARAQVADLLERPLHEAPSEFELRPFQILTLRLRPA
jgi:alpha-mannosidase